MFDLCTFCIYTWGCKGVKDDNNRQIKDIAESLKSIATSLKFFERIVLNDSNYVSKNKKDIDVNINKINGVIKDIKEKI